MIKNRFSFSLLLLLILFSVFITSCKKQVRAIDPDKPQRSLKEYFDKKYLLYQLPADFYSSIKQNQSFVENGKNSHITFMPLGYDPTLNLQYTHVYSKDCIYHPNDSTWKFAEVCFPNTCLTKEKVYAKVAIQNTGPQPETYFLRLFYQNTSYWYPTNDSINLSNKEYLDNYYGASEVITLLLEAKGDTVVEIPYTIGMNPKHEFDEEPSNDPVRPGNYEFMLLTLSDSSTPLMKANLGLQKINPFAEVKQDELQNSGKKYFNHSSYTGPKHFKFVFLDEYFDGVNDTTANHIYLPKDRVQKNYAIPVIIGFGQL